MSSNCSALKMNHYTSIATEVLWLLPADDLAESPSKACLMNIFLSIKTLAHSKLKNIKFCILENLTFYNVPQMSLHPILKVYLI